MSSGPNQHYLPRFLQKPFGIRPKRKDIWIFACGREPEAKRIKHVGAGEYFYSEPAADGAQTLDDEITDIETSMSRMLADIRAAPIGAQISSANAAEVLTHLIPRTAHVRVSMERGLRMMARGVETIISDSEHLQALMGLDEDEPNEAFRENLAEKLDEIEGLAGLGLPRDLTQRIAFVLAKENFATMASDFLPVFRGVLSKWLDTAGNWKERIIIDGGAALALLSEDSSTVEWGLYILVRQLSEVAITDMLDRSLPGVWMRPIEDQLQGFLYTNVHPAVFGYLPPAPQDRECLRKDQGLAPRRHPLRPMRAHLHVRHLHRRNLLLLVVINES